MMEGLTASRTWRILERAMTNEELFQDLKQFITATVSQQTSQLEQRLDTVEQRIGGVEAKMATKEDIDRLDKKLDQIQDAIADTLTQATETLDATVQDHERRLHTLERRTV
jgi:hypothetical protein